MNGSGTRSLTALYVAAPFSMGYVDFYTFLMPLYALSLGFDAAEVGILVGARSIVAMFLSIHTGVLMDRFGTCKVTLFFVWASMDLRFGMGMGTVHVNSPERRDRLWLINAFAVVLLTLLGAAGEALGYDRMLKTNTTKRRVHSLFRQGCMLYDLIPMMPEGRLRPLMERFSRMLHEQPLFADVFGPV